VSFIAGLDTFQLKSKTGRYFNCKGNDCDMSNETMNCETFEDGKKYQLKGKLLTKHYENETTVFQVFDYKMSK
jgi:hypothetical protein